MIHAVTKPGELAATCLLCHDELFRWLQDHVAGVTTDSARRRGQRTHDDESVAATGIAAAIVEESCQGNEPLNASRIQRFRAEQREGFIRHVCEVFREVMPLRDEARIARARELTRKRLRYGYPLPEAAKLGVASLLDCVRLRTLKSLWLDRFDEIAADAPRRLPPLKRFYGSWAYFFRSRPSRPK